MYYVLLSGYNNYYNRIYKRENTIQEYIDASSEYVVFQDGMNFEYRDGVSTEKLFNTGAFTGEPNYLLLKENANDTVPSSRWFVVDWEMVRGNQYKAILRRDLLADNYDAIMESPCFIEKGYVGPEDSAIFNKENITVNQIKTRETLLKDDSKTAWIVGYIAQDHPALTDKQFTLDPNVDMVITGNFSDWEYANWCDGLPHTTIDESNIENIVRYVLRAQKIREFQFNSSSHSSFDSVANDAWNISSTGSKTAQQVLEDYINSEWISNIDWKTVLSKIYLDNSSYANSTVMSTLNSLIGKRVQFADGVYEFRIATTSQQSGWKYWDNGNLYNYLYSIVLPEIQALGGTISSAVTRYPVAYLLKLTSFIITAQKLENVQGVYKYSLPQTTRKLEDAPYKMFCMPYYTGSGRYTFSLDGSTYIYIDKDIQMGWAMSLAKELGDSLYDLQILPYCPLSNWKGRANSSGIWSVDKTVDKDYIELKGSNNTVYGYCSFCGVSSKEQFLKYPIEIMDYKLENQCDMYRLCSPNYASVFEFNAARNGGVEGYNVRYTYKPYQPFINVAPKFGRLYGKDFKDNRGLILSGDFSLPIVREAWINYQLQNKNYQLAFDRQIENLEVNYGWQRAQGIANAVVGTLQGGTTGAMAGGMMGGVAGAAVGGVVGAVGALGTGKADIEMQKALHNEAIDYAKDNFGFQLGNIKALPNTLNKVSSIVANSKLFPFVEYYTCTEEEKKAFDDKIKYNGMTIGRIGHILDFKHPDAQTYVKGQIIRLEGEFDTHEANEIANEFMKGWYI